MRTDRVRVTAIVILMASCSAGPQSEQRTSAAKREQRSATPVPESVAAEALDTAARRDSVPATPNQNCRPSACRVMIADGPRPVALQRVKPLYPREAAERGIGGDVEVVASIDKAGTVVSACRSSGPEAFWESSEAAARKWRFAPRQTGWSGCIQMIVRFSFKPERP